MKARVLFIVESGTDVRLVEGLAQQFELTIIARKIDGGVEISQPPSIKRPIVLGPPGRGKFSRRVFWELLRRRNHYDLVLVQGYGLAALAANSARLITNKPVIMLVCSPAEAYYRCRVEHPDGRPYREHEASALKLLARANALLGERYVVLSRYLEQVVRSHGARRVDVIPLYGVDTRIFAPPLIAQHLLKAQLKLPATGTLIFFSSRVAPEKDSETLLKAVRQLVNEGQDIWVLHRSGGYRQFLADAERFGIASRVIATDAVHPHHELPLDYQACDLCVQASREEGLGFSPLEALACETPVIATSVGGLKETILEGETGWQYPVGDEVALANTIKKVAFDPIEGTRLAANGRQMVVERFDSRRVFLEFTALVGNAVGEATQPPHREPDSAFTSSIPIAPRPFRPLKIVLAAHVSREGFTAVYRNTCQRAAYLESRGHQCTVLTPDDFPSVPGITGRFTPVLFPIALAVWLARQPQNYEVAMFHSYAGWVVSLVRRVLGWHRTTKLITMFHGLEPLYFQRMKAEVPLSLRYRLMHGLLMHRLLRFSCRNSDLVMCLNSEESSFIVNNRWSSSDRTVVVKNPAPMTFFQVERSYREHGTRLLFVGQWLPMKGTEYLVRAFAQVEAKFSDVQLCCAGTLASEADVLKSFPEEVRAKVTVRPRVTQEELLEIHESADIFVFPSLSEAWGVAITEAMATALPIVSTPVGAALDLLHNNSSALIVPVKNADALTSAIESLIDNRIKRQILGQNARHAANDLDPSSVWREYAFHIAQLFGFQSTVDETAALATVSGRGN